MCNVTHKLLVKGKRCDEAAFHKMCNVTTHRLLVIGKDLMRLHLTKCAMSLTLCGHRKGCDEIAFHKMCNVTHLLSQFILVGKDVMRLMRLPFTRCATSLTIC